MKFAKVLYRYKSFGRVTLFHGDCLQVLQAFSDQRFDALVTDPPAGIAFMGKDWDKDKGGRNAWVAWMTDVMCEAYRVLKPGAHGLVWALPRTSHWTATALEDAGFEVRDVITHLFGTGFPKSHDVSKAIDKAAGAEREVTGPKSTYRKPQAPNGWDCTQRVEFETAPATGAAKQWHGWGTALKPASEHWILIRKPLGEKTVAANVLKHGTGGINVDAGRITAPGGLTKGGSCKGESALPMNKANGLIEARERSEEHPQGRFPANVTLDEEAAKALDEQSGALASGARKAGVRKGLGFHGANGDGGPAIEANTGGASRFFYVAKASKADRGEGNTHPTVKSTALMRYLIKLITPKGGRVLDPFAGSGSTGVAALVSGFRFTGIDQSKEYFRIALRRLG